MGTLYERIKNIEDRGIRIGICVLDAEGNNLFKYKTNEKFDTACSIMCFIMMEYFNQINEGNINGSELITYTEENFATGSGVIKLLTPGNKVKACDLVELMIVVSDHIAANMLIDFLGINNINDTIRNVGFRNTTLHHKFLIPKLKNMGTSTPYEMALFYKKLMDHSIINSVLSKQMVEILIKQKYKDILTDNIDKLDGVYIDVACKSGKADGKMYDMTTDSYIVDAGIIFTNYNDYSISIMLELSYYSKVTLNEAKYEMQEISKMIYEIVTKEYV